MCGQAMRSGRGRSWCGWMRWRYCRRRCRGRWTTRGRRRCRLVAEVLEAALPEGAVEDAVFRLALAVLDELQVGRVWMPITYFALWMNRLMGWMPELGRCAACGLDLGGAGVWYSTASDGVTCADDRVGGSEALSAESVATAGRIFRGTVKGLAEEEWPKARAAEPAAVCHRGAGTAPGGAADDGAGTGAVEVISCRLQVVSFQL